VTVLKVELKRKFKPMPCVLCNYILRISDHPSFTDICNSMLPGKFRKNILMINEKFNVRMTRKIIYSFQQSIKDFKSLRHVTLVVHGVIEMYS